MIEQPDREKPGYKEERFESASALDLRGLTIVANSGLTFEEYQRRAHLTAVFPHHVPDNLAGIVYCALGLAGEAGEVAGKVKKLLRDSDTPEKRRIIVAELGDCLWYIPELLHELGEYQLEDAARENLEKLLGRKERGTLHGDGDVR